MKRRTKNQGTNLAPKELFLMTETLEERIKSSAKFPPRFVDRCLHFPAFAALSHCSTIGDLLHSGKSESE